MLYIQSKNYNSDVTLEAKAKKEAKMPNIKTNKHIQNKWNLLEERPRQKIFRFTNEFVMAD